MEQKNINICISYDQVLVAEGINAILSRHKGIVVSQMCKNGIEDISNGIIKYNNDILLFEAEHLFPNSFHLLKNIHRMFPALRLLVISGFVSRTNLDELMQVIDGYILRTCQTEKLITAVYQIKESGKYLCPKIVSTLFDRNEHQNQLKSDISNREKEILILWFQLEDISLIADKLHISKSTVRTHLKNIRDKLGKPGLVKMIFYACMENQVAGDEGSICPFCNSACTAFHLQDLYHASRENPS